jgi:hypothetical protein
VFILIKHKNAGSHAGENNTLQSTVFTVKLGQFRVVGLRGCFIVVVYYSA